MLDAISAGQVAGRANIGSSPMPTTPSISFMQDDAGRIVARSLDLGHGPEITRYAYDSAGRLARVTDGGGALRESYQYDREARRLADINPLRFRGERRYTYSLGDRLLQAGDAQYAHDPAGFRSLKVAAGRQTQYHYEPSGLLLAVELPDGRRVEYGYDADGLRREKRIDGALAQAFRWLDPLRLLEFYDGERWWRLAYTQGRTPVGVTDGSASYLLLADQIGTPLALATPDGNVVQAMRYDSFGNLLDVAGEVVRLPLGFAGGLFDGDTGLTRFVWRDYDADTGRFTALDPLGEKGGDNDWYGYCLDDPINRADVWGLEVQVCRRPVDIDNQWLHDHIDHFFIKTDSTESGIGIPGRPANQGDSVADFLSKIEWVDHKGQSRQPNATCWSVPNVDEKCVDALVQPGTDAGRWIPGFNDCRTNPTEVLDYCRTDVP
jgi:RHS repeat-associated protein